MIQLIRKDFRTHLPFILVTIIAIPAIVGLSLFFLCWYLAGAPVIHEASSISQICLAVYCAISYLGWFMNSCMILGHEHREGTAKFMFSLPPSAMQVGLSKLIICLLIGAWVLLSSSLLSHFLSSTFGKPAGVVDKSLGVAAIYSFLVFFAAGFAWMISVRIRQPSVVMLATLFTFAAVTIGSLEWQALPKFWQVYYLFGSHDSLLNNEIFRYIVLGGLGTCFFAIGTWSYGRRSQP